MLLYCSLPPPRFLCLCSDPDSRVPGLHNILNIHIPICNEGTEHVLEELDICAIKVNYAYYYSNVA